MKMSRGGKGMEKQKRLEGKLKAFFAVFVFIGITIAVFSIFIFHSPFPIDDRQYLLSSISQGLAAMFTLVITVTLIASQMLVKYGSDQLDRIFSIPVIFYLLIFIFSILFPLFLLLNNNHNYRSVQFSLLLTAICLLFLFPYIYWFKEIVKPENIIDYNLNKLKKKI